MVNAIGFGVEIETSVKPKTNGWEDKIWHFNNFAEKLRSEYGLKVYPSPSGRKKPPDSNYDKWWITSDASIVTSSGFCMRQVFLEPLYWIEANKFSWNGVYLP
jgi:hypothetical protein